LVHGTHQMTPEQAREAGARYRLLLASLAESAAIKGSELTAPAETRHGSR